MAVERKDREIGGKLYSILLPPPTKAMSLCNEAAVLFGPLIGGLGANAQGGGWQMFAMLLRGVDPAALDAIFLRTVQGVNLTCDGVSVSGEAPFEKHFSANRRDLYPACFWALWESVNPFFPDLGAFTSKIESFLAKASQSQTDGA